MIGSDFTTRVRIGSALWKWDSNLSKDDYKRLAGFRLSCDFIYVFAGFAIFDVLIETFRILRILCPETGYVVFECSGRLGCILQLFFAGGAASPEFADLSE